MVRYLRPEYHDNQNLAMSWPVQALIFVRYGKDNDMNLQALSSDECLNRLLTEECLRAAGSTARDIKDALQWILTLPAFEFTYGPGVNAVVEFSNLLDNAMEAYQTNLTNN